MKNLSTQCFTVIALFILTTVTCGAVDSTDSTLYQTPQARKLGLGSGQTATATKTASGNITSACPAGYVYTNVSFSDPSVYLYNPIGGTPSCSGGWHQCFAGEFRGSLSCWCWGSPNNCCNSAFGNCNYWDPNLNCTPTAAGSWQGRGALPPTYTNAPSVMSGGTCVTTTWQNAP